MEFAMSAALLLYHKWFKPALHVALLSTDLTALIGGMHVRCSMPDNAHDCMFLGAVRHNEDCMQCSRH